MNKLVKTIAIDDNLHERIVKKINELENQCGVNLKIGSVVQKIISDNIDKFSINNGE